MRIPTWRLVLTGAAIVILVTVGVGLVAASANPAAAPTGNSSVAAAPGSSPAASDATGNHPGLRKLLARLGRVGEGAHAFVNGTLHFIDKSGNLITIQLDHGTIASIGNGTLTISEAGGTQVTVSTDTTTVVRLGGGAGIGKLSDLKVGDQVFVQSRVDGGTTLAKHILRVPATTSTTTGG